MDGDAEHDENNSDRVPQRRDLSENDNADQRCRRRQQSEQEGETRAR